MTRLKYVQYPYWPRFRQDFEFSPFQIFLLLAVYMVSFSKKVVAFLFHFLFRSFRFCRPFFVIFNVFVCWGFIWVTLVVTSTARTAVIVLPLSLLIVLVSTSLIIFGVSATSRFLFLSQKKPKKALFRYHSFFPWNILKDFSLYIVRSSGEVGKWKN